MNLQVPGDLLGACISLAPPLVYLSAYSSRVLPRAPSSVLGLILYIRSLARMLAHAWRMTDTYLESSSLY